MSAMKKKKKKKKKKILAKTLTSIGCLQFVLCGIHHVVFYGFQVFVNYISDGLRKEYGHRGITVQVTLGGTNDNDFANI